MHQVEKIIDFVCKATNAKPGDESPFKLKG